MSMMLPEKEEFENVSAVRYVLQVCRIPIGIHNSNSEFQNCIYNKYNTNLFLTDDTRKIKQTAIQLNTMHHAVL